MPIHLPLLLTEEPSMEHPPAAPAFARARRRLVDSHGRTIRDLRLSVTDRCNFRCIYCLDPEVRFLPRRELLRPDEMVRLARICGQLGVEKVRLTGGEPLLHPGLDDVIRGVARAGRFDIALTTNGSLLTAERVRELRAVGLSRLTISLDSMDQERFAGITRSSARVSQVVQAVRDSIAAGLSPVKVNAVISRGINEAEIPSLAGLARELAIEVRFIEVMPLDSQRAWDRSRLVPASEILERISRHYRLVELGRSGRDRSSTASLYGFADGAPGSIGIIASVTRPFCNQCSRLRITADGRVRPCLFSDEEWDLRPLLRGDADDAQIADFLIDATWAKQKGHGISSANFVQPVRHMAAIGG